MGPASGQVRRWIGEALERLRPSRPGLAGLCQELEGAAAPLPWDELAVLCERLEPLLGGRQALVDAARDFTTAKLEARSHEHIGFADERQAFWFASQALGPALFPDHGWSFEALDASRLRITVTLPNGARPCDGFFSLLHGVLSAVPRAEARGLVRVSCCCDERSARYEVETASRAAAPFDTRRLAALAAHSDAVFLEANAEGTVVFVSPNCEQILGVTPDSLIGKTPETLVQPISRAVAADVVSRMHTSDEPTHAEFAYERSDGTERWGSATCQTFCTETGARHMVAVIREVTEQKEAERIRHERFDLLERVARATPDTMMVIDAEAGRITGLSEGEKSWLGVPKDSYTGHTPGSFDSVVHPDDLPKLAEHRERTAQLAPGEVSEIAMRVRQPDRGWRWLRLRDVVFSRKEDGSPKEILVCISDITEKVEMAAALAESQERYRRISELASDYSFCVRIDADGVVEREWMTDAFYRITGYTPEEAPLDGWDRLVHPDDHETCRKSFAEGLERGEGSFEFRLLTRSGEIRWVREHFEVVRGDEGTVRIYAACGDVTEQRQAEHERRLIEDRYHAITENSWDIVGELDPVGVPTYISPNLQDVLGWTPEELIASRNPDLLHPDDRPVIAEQIIKMLQGADEARMVLRVRHKQGGWRHVELTATAFRGRDGLRRGVFLGRDVSERLRMEAEHERLGSVVSASSELIAIFEPDGRLLFLNRAGRRMTGLGSRGLGGTTLFDLMDHSEGTRLRQEALDTALHEHTWEGECRLQPQGGDAFPVLANLFQLPDPRPGEGCKLALVARDIRARKRVENALHESEKRFRLLVENAFDMIAEVDEDGNFVYVSPRYRDLLGYDTTALLGEPALDLLHEDDRARVEELVDSFGDRPLTDLGQMRVRGRDGAWHWLESQVRPYARRSGENLLVVVSRDISDRRQTEEALRLSQEALLQSQKMEAIGRLAGGVAHDFNNLLTAITGYGDLIYQELGEGDPLREDAGEVLRAAEQASGLTRQLLAFSRRQVLQPRVVELNSLVSDVDRLLRRLIGDHIELATSLAPDVGPVRVDPGQVEQLLVNLAVNARDAMPNGGRLEIVTGALQLAERQAAHPGVPPGAWITLAVSDTGEGMSGETVERIFEPFFTTKATGKGTGLGLSTVYGIVQQSGGHIRVDSEAQRGTTFTVYLPRSEDSPDPVEPQPVMADLRGSETVVLVEDEESVRRLLTRYLAEHGYPVIAAGSAVEALRAMRRHEGPVDLLITGVVLPKMDGHALAERLRWDHPGLKVLFVSGFSEDEVAPPSPECREHAFIQQPFAPPQLLQQMRLLLNPS